MPLIVEDGTAKADAESYISADDAKALATKRGIVLSASDTELEQNLVSAADRLTAYENAYSGKRVSAAQGLSYPRIDSYRYGGVIGVTDIPKELKLAQVTIAGLIAEGVDIWFNADSSGIKSEKISVLEVQYSDSKAASVGNPDLPQIESILAPLFGEVFGNNFIVSR